MRLALRCLAVLMLAGLGSVAALGLSDWPAGYALRYGLWWLSGHGQEREYTSDDDTPLHYVEAGKGPPLVLLHGGGGNRDAFFAQLPFLARHFHVYALDSRGHGRSERGEGSLSYERYAEDVFELLDRRHIARAALIGWSDGGNTGLVLASEHPERICRMVVIGANYDPSGVAQDPPEPPRPPHEWTSELVEDLYDLLLPSDYANSPSSDELEALWASGPDLTPAALHQIKAQVLVIGGEYDLIERDHLISTQQAIPGARLEIFPDVGHSLMQDVPAKMNRSLRKFLLDRDGRPQPC
ncbi:MAG TPA: alpha/beta hydrolase [Myxococcota bacterium]|nr:alpha/beta hydrolase [Myxococcota bacterium]